MEVELEDTFWGVVFVGDNFLESVWPFSKSSE
jgi:hypothetical protein